MSRPVAPNGSTELPATINVPLMKSLLVILVISIADHATSGTFAGIDEAEQVTFRSYQPSVGVPKRRLQTGGL